MNEQSSQVESFPIWLDEFIYGQLGAKYAPDFNRYTYNVDLNPEELKIYLGTYFPRSFVECRYLFLLLFQRTNYADIMRHKQTLNILDFGCGSGGNLMGFLEFADCYLPDLQHVNIIAIDANHGALRLCEKVVAEFQKRSRLSISMMPGPAFVGDNDGLCLICSILDQKFDVILSFKAICELVAKKRIDTNAYRYCASLLSAKLADDGIMLFVDVTVKSDVVGMFVPQYMNTGLNEFVVDSGGEYATILPVSCRKNGSRCKCGCFFSEILHLQHSHAVSERTKIVYRFMGHRALSEQICKTQDMDISCKYK